MRWSKKAHRIGLESEPCGIPLNDIPVAVKSPFFFANDTASLEVSCECCEILRKMSKVMGKASFSSDIVFGLLVNLCAPIRSCFGLKIGDLVNALKLDAVSAGLERLQQ